MTQTVPWPQARTLGSEARARKCPPCALRPQRRMEPFRGASAAPGPFQDQGWAPGSSEVTGPKPRPRRPLLPPTIPKEAGR